MPTILIICTGNLCRSPMAETLLRAKLHQDEERSDWQVSSAGTWATEGRPASAYAIAEMSKRGLDLRSHRSRPITGDLMKEADLVLGATQNHVEALQAAFPDQADKVHLLSEMVGQGYDISDPYGGTKMEYAYIAQELEELIEEGYDRIVALTEEWAEK